MNGKGTKTYIHIEKVFEEMKEKSCQAVTNKAERKNSNANRKK